MELKSVATMALGIAMVAAAIGNAAFDWNYRYLRNINRYMRLLQGSGQSIDGPVDRFTWRWFTSGFLAFFGAIAVLSVISKQ